MRLSNHQAHSFSVLMRTLHPHKLHLGTPPMESCWNPRMSPRCSPTKQVWRQGKRGSRSCRSTASRLLNMHKLSIASAMFMKDRWLPRRPITTIHEMLGLVRLADSMTLFSSMSRLLQTSSDTGTVEGACIWDLPWGGMAGSSLYLSLMAKVEELKTPEKRRLPRLFYGHASRRRCTMATSPSC